MNAKTTLLALALVGSFALGSCSGPKNRCVTNCGVTGNATVSITLYDTPPTGLTLLSFTLPVAGISLTPSSGSDVPVTTTTTSVETTRLQTDSALIADAAGVPSGSYTTLKVILGPTTATSSVFINTSGSTITWTTAPAGSCANLAVCNLPAGAIYTIAIPMTLSLSNRENQWIGLDLNLNKAITTAGGLSVDFSQPGVLTAITKARTGIPSSAVDTIEDFVGKVTAYSSGSTISIQSSISGQTITAALSSTTQYDAPDNSYSSCTAVPACLKVGSTVSLDALLSSSGMLVATEVDVLDAAAVDEVEGVIYPTKTANVYGLILADKFSASGNAVLAASTTTYGTGIFLNVGSANIFDVDKKTLTNSGFSFLGFSNSSDLLAGQMVRAQVSNVTSTNSGITATANKLLLRFSRLAGTVSSVASPNFNFTPPSYVSVLDTGLSLSPVAYTSSIDTAFDGVTNTADPNFTTGTTVAIRALFLNNALPTFAVAKVRVP